MRAAGSYAVTVSDVSGCTGTSDSARVAVTAPPVAAITPAGPLTLTPGDSLVLDAGSGHAAYRWMRGASAMGALQRLTVRDSGDYAVTVTDASGCSASATVRVDLDASAGASG